MQMQLSAVVRHDAAVIEMPPVDLERFPVLTDDAHRFDVQCGAS
jgi:hypothetical protein